MGNKKLIHYTSIAGLSGILQKTGEFWLSNTDFCDDRQEFYVGYLRKILQENYFKEKKQQWKVERVVDAFQTTKQKLRMCAYIGCFSECDPNTSDGQYYLENGHLPMWKYCTARHKGKPVYGLVFDQDKLLNGFADHYQRSITKANEDSIIETDCLGRTPMLFTHPKVQYYNPKDTILSLKQRLEDFLEEDRLIENKDEQIKCILSAMDYLQEHDNPNKKCISGFSSDGSGKEFILLIGLLASIKDFGFRDEYERRVVLVKAGLSDLQGQSNSELASNTYKTEEKNDLHITEDKKDYCTCPINLAAIESILISPLYYDSPNAEVTRVQNIIRLNTKLSDIDICVSATSWKGY